MPASWVVDQPDRARDSIRTLMAASVRASAASKDPSLARALQLGADYAKVWSDSFPLREVQRFAALSLENRARRIQADSLRRAGNAALGREGFAAAAHYWRLSRSLAQAIGDTAAMAAATGNIGTGFYQEAQLDSAARYYTETRRLARLGGDRRTELNALTGLASISKDRGDYTTAAREYRDALYLRRQIGDYRGVAADADNLGLVAEATGNRAEARRRYTEALVTARDHGFDDASAAALVNLGALANSEGDERIAERRYRQALELYRKLDNRADQALVLRNLGLLNAGQGEYPAAAANYEEALALLQQAGSVEALVGTQVDLSQVLAAMGNLDGADRVLRAAVRSVEDDGLEHLALKGRLWLARGDIALDFNQLASARKSYWLGLSLLHRAKDPNGEAEARAALGALSLIEEDYLTARGLLSSAATEQQAVGDHRSAALTELLASRAAREMGDTADARRRITRAVDTLRVSGDRVAHTWALCESGNYQHAVGAFRAAEAAYRNGLTRLGRSPAIGASVCLYGGLGRTLQARGATRDGIAALQRGIAEIELAATAVRTIGRRSDFLSDKWELYTDLALAQYASGDTAAAFETSERLRARQTLSLISDTPASNTDLPHPRVAALRRRIAALRDDPRTHKTTLTLRGVDELHTATRLRVELGAAELEYAQLLDSLEAAGSPAAPRPIDRTGWREVAERVPADAALIEYLVTDSVVLAFVVLSDRLSVVRLPVTGTALTGEVDFVRGLMAPRGRANGGSPWEAPLRRLRGQLITPLEEAGLLRGKGRLLIVPHRELHYLPFAALLEPGASGQFLAQRYQIGHVASGAVWRRLQARPSKVTGQKLLALAPRPDDLPGARAEVRAIANLYGADARVMIGPGATQSFLAEAVPGRSIVHLASRGILNRHNPRFSYIALAPDGDSDGQLAVHDVMRLAIDARLVVLSACQTGLGSGRLVDVPPGDDWVGLVQAFQSAGARNVLATLWPVDDRATGGLMKQFYLALKAGASESGALADAQRRAIASASTRSPFYWAGFVLNGDL